MAHPLFRQNAVYFAGSVLALAFAFVYQFITGRLLGPERYATVGAIFSLYFVLMVPGLMVTTIGTRQAALLKASGSTRELGLLFRRSTLQLFALSTLGSLAFSTLIVPIGGFLHVPVVSLLVLVPAIVLLLPTSLNRGVLQGEQRFVRASFVLLLDAFSRTVLAVFLIAIGLGAEGAVLALSIGVAISYAISLLLLRDLVRGSVSSGIQEPLSVTAFTGPTMIAVLGITLLYTVDVLLVKHFLAAGQSGLYVSVVTLGRLIFMMTTSITAVMFAQVAGWHTRKLPNLRILTFSALGIGGIGLGIVVAFAVGPGVALLPFGPAFSQAAPYLPFFGAAMTMLSLANLLINYLVAIHDARFVPVILLADIAEIVLISTFHPNLWTVIAIVFGVASGSLLALVALVMLPPTGRWLRPG